MLLVNMYFKFNAAVAVAAVLALLSITTATPVAGKAAAEAMVDGRCPTGMSPCVLEHPNGQEYIGCCGL